MGRAVIHEEDTPLIHSTALPEWHHFRQNISSMKNVNVPVNDLSLQLSDRPRP